MGTTTIILKPRQTIITTTTITTITIIVTILRLQLQTILVKLCPIHYWEGELVSSPFLFKFFWFIVSFCKGGPCFFLVKHRKLNENIYPSLPFYIFHKGKIEMKRTLKVSFCLTRKKHLHGQVHKETMNNFALIKVRHCSATIIIRWKKK
jgi:hypothetical protein